MVSNVGAVTAPSDVLNHRPTHRLGEGERPDPDHPTELQQEYDWDSPKWAWDGVSGGATVAERIRHGAGRLRLGCVRAKVFNVSGLVHDLPWARNRPLLPQRVHSTS